MTAPNLARVRLNKFRDEDVRKKLKELESQGRGAASNWMISAFKEKLARDAQGTGEDPVALLRKRVDAMAERMDNIYSMTDAILNLVSKIKGNVSVSEEPRPATSRKINLAKIRGQIEQKK